MKLRNFIVLPLLLMLAACDTPADYSLDPQPVIEGWIDSDGYPNVIFTVAYSPEETDVSVADKLIRWGKVTVSDGSDTVVLTGGMSDDFFPPFVYRSYRMKGRPGRTYTVTAEYRNLRATAVATMPEPPVIAGVATRKIATSDTLRSVTVTVRAPADGCPAYYHVSTKVLPDELRYLPALFGCVRADVPGEEVEIPVYRGKTSISDGDYMPQLPSNRTVMIKVERVTRQIYDFWNMFNSASAFGGSQFVSQASSLPTNVSNGLGYGSAQGAVILSLPPVSGY